MSERAGLIRKDGGGKTKYSSLNLNQTYKGSQPDRRTTVGGRHGGLQSLGKVQGGRRPVPAPANLPSLKFENAGNDPSVSIVPSGGAGWGSSRDNKPVENGPSEESRQRPVAAVDHSRQHPTLSSRSGDGPSSSRTWGSMSKSPDSNGRAPTGSFRFQRDFPTLGREGGSAPPSEREDSRHYGAGPPLRPQGMSGTQGYGQLGGDFHRRLGPGPPERGSRPSSYGPGPGPGRMGPPPHVENGHGPYQVAPPSSGYRPHNYGYPPHSGNYPPGRHEGGHGDRPVSSRPATVRPEAIQRLDRSDEDDESGWAGQQEEVDFNAKLTWGDSDEELESRSGAKGSALKEGSRWKGQAEENTRQWQQHPGHMHRYHTGSHRPSWQQNGPSVYYQDHRNGGLPPGDGAGYYRDDYASQYRYDRHENHQPPPHNVYPDRGPSAAPLHDRPVSESSQPARRGPEKVEPPVTKSSVEQARMRWEAEEERRREQRARAEAKLLELDRRRAAGLSASSSAASSVASSAALSAPSSAPSSVPTSSTTLTFNTSSSGVTPSSTSPAPLASRRSPDEGRQQELVATANASHHYSDHYSDQQWQQDDFAEVRPTPARPDFQPHYVEQYRPDDHRRSMYSHGGAHDEFSRRPQSDAPTGRAHSAAAPPANSVSRPLPSPEPRNVDLSSEDSIPERKETTHVLTDGPSREAAPVTSEPSTTTAVSGQEYQRSRMRRREVTLRAMNDDRQMPRSVPPVPKRPDSVRASGENAIADEHTSDSESKPTGPAPPMKIMTRQKDDTVVAVSRAAADSATAHGNKTSEPSGESGVSARPVAAAAPPPTMSAWGKNAETQLQTAVVSQSLRPEEWPTAEQSKGMAAPKVKEDSLKDRSILRPAIDGVRDGDRQHDGYDQHRDMDERYDGRGRRDRYDRRERSERYTRDRHDFEGRGDYDRGRREHYGPRERSDRYEPRDRPDRYSQHERPRRYARGVDEHERDRHGPFREHDRLSDSYQRNRSDRSSGNGLVEEERKADTVNERESDDSKEAVASDDSRSGPGSRPASTESGLQRNVRNTDGQPRELYRGYDREYGRESRRGQRGRSSDVSESSREYDRYRDGEPRRGRGRGVRGGRAREDRVREPARGRSRRYNDDASNRDAAIKQIGQASRSVEKGRAVVSAESSDNKEGNRENSETGGGREGKVATRVKEKTSTAAGKGKDVEQSRDEKGEMSSGKEQSVRNDRQVKDKRLPSEHGSSRERASRVASQEGEKERGQVDSEERVRREKDRRTRSGDLRERDRPRDSDREKRDKPDRERTRTDRAREYSDKDRNRDHGERGYRGDRSSRDRERANRERGEGTRRTGERSIRERGENDRGESRRYRDVRDHDDDQQGSRARGARSRREGGDGSQSHSGRTSGRGKGVERQRSADSGGSKEATKDSDCVDDSQEKNVNKETSEVKKEQADSLDERRGKDKQAGQSENSSNRNGARRTASASSLSRGRGRQAGGTREEVEGRGGGLRREGRDGDSRSRGRETSASSGRSNRDAKESVGRRNAASSNSSSTQGQTSGRVKSFSRQRPGSSKPADAKDGSDTSKSRGKADRSNVEGNTLSRRPVRKDVKRDQKTSSPTVTRSSTPPIKRNPLLGIDLNSASVCIVDDIPDHSSSSSSADGDDSAGFQTVLSRGKQQKEKRERRQASEELRHQEARGSENSATSRPSKTAKEESRSTSQQQTQGARVKSKSTPVTQAASQAQQPVSSSSVSPSVSAASSSLFSSATYPNVASYALTVSGTTASSSDWSVGSTTTTSVNVSSSTTWSEPPPTSQAYLVSPFDTPLLFSSGNQSTSQTVGAVGTRTASTSGPMLRELIKAGPPTDFPSGGPARPQGAVGQKVVKAQAKAPGTGKPGSAGGKSEPRGRGRGSRPRSTESTSTRPGYSRQGSSSNSGSQPDLSVVGVKGSGGTDEGRSKLTEKNTTELVTGTAPKPKRQQQRTRVRVEDGKAKESVESKDGDVLPLASSPGAEVASSQLALHSSSSVDATSVANLPANPRPAVSPASSDLAFSQLSFNDGPWSVLDSSNKPAVERESTADHASVGIAGSKSTPSSVGENEQLAAKTQQAAYNAWHTESTDEPTGGEGTRASVSSTVDEDKLAGQSLAMNPFLGMKQSATPHSALFPSQGMFPAPIFPKPLLQQPHYVFPQPQPPPQPRGFSHDFVGGFSGARSAALGPYIQSTIGNKVGQQQPRMMLAANLQSNSTGPGVLTQTMSTGLPQPMMMNAQRSSLLRSATYTQGQTMAHPQVGQVHAPGAQPVPGVGGYLKQQQPPSQQQQQQVSSSRIAGVMTGSKLASGSELSKLVDAKPFTPLSSSTEQPLSKFEILGQRSQTLAGLSDIAQQQQAVYGSRAVPLNASKMAALAQPMPGHYASQQQQFGTPFQQAAALPPSYGARHPPPVNHSMLGQQHLMAQRVVAAPHAIAGQGYALQGMATQHQHAAGLIGPPPVAAPTVTPTHAFVQHGHSSSQRQSNLPLQHGMPSLPLVPQQTAPDPQKQLMREAQQKCLQETSTYMREQREKEEFARLQHQSVQSARMATDGQLPTPPKVESSAVEAPEGTVSQDGPSVVMASADSASTSVGNESQLNAVMLEADQQLPVQSERETLSTGVENSMLSCDSSLSSAVAIETAQLPLLDDVSSALSDTPSAPSQPTGQSSAIVGDSSSPPCLEVIARADTRDDVPISEENSGTLLTVATSLISES